MQHDNVDDSCHRPQNGKPSNFIVIGNFLTTNLAFAIEFLLQKLSNVKSNST